ncbi:MAG: DUF3500 domain-containing protein [Acidobacteria bacterium]|nr:DUF3500 domain-containing protein [Acidobacteriota bacterium]MBI3471051.1 DUF3500 domain-containing protein [Candidatus Solibacter usitatus]
MKQTVVRLVAVAAAILLLTSAYSRIPASGVMAQAANAFLNSLTPEQKAQAVFKFPDEERFNWHFIPKERKGLPLRAMTPPQKHLAQALLNAGLSQSGYIKAISIMSLEDVLRIQEKDNGERRNPEKYYFSIFGEPGDHGTWGYRVEGHHVAQNYTVVNGKVIGAPSFFGANPAEVREGPRTGLRVLAGEEDLGRELMTALDESQRKTALVDATAYKDILTAANRKAALEGQASGLPASRMNAKQFGMLTALLQEYAHNMPEQLAQARMEQVKKAGKNIHFAWAGVLDKGGPHYYRVQAPSFLIEYDNTQNNSNHIHSVWRDYNGDFGLDLLKEHLQTSHR